MISEKTMEARFEAWQKLVKVYGDDKHWMALWMLCEEMREELPKNSSAQCIACLAMAALTEIRHIQMEGTDNEW